MSENSSIKDDLIAKKIEIEIEKLKLEADEIRERKLRAKAWYKGRYLFQALIGGAVTGALVVTWFIQFYSPIINNTKERLESARITYEKKLKSHIEFSQSIIEGYDKIEIWAEGLGKRLNNQLTLVENQLTQNYQYQEQIHPVFTYLKKESENIDEVISLLQTDISQGNEDIVRLKDGFAELENPNYEIQILYDYEFKDYAFLAEKVLAKSGFNIRIDWWSDYKETDDGPMFRFFKDGPVLWYDKTHFRTNDKVKMIVRALADAFPENMLVKHGYHVVVPGWVRQPPNPYRIELWLFKNRDK